MRHKRHMRPDKQMRDERPRRVGLIAWFLSALLSLTLLFAPALASAAEGAAMAAPKTESAQAANSLGPVGLSGEGSDAPASSRLKMPAVPAGFKTYDGGWLQMAYHPSLESRVQVLQGQAGDVRRELESLLGQPVLKKVHVRVGRTAGEMETLGPEGSRPPKYAAGLAYSELGLVLLTAAPRYPGANHDLGEVFRHELAHIALHDAVGRENIPRWFNEGFAVHASGEEHTARMQALWTATTSGNLIPFKKITRSFPADSHTASIAYAQAADMLRFLLRGGEEHRFQALIRRVNSGQSFDEALLNAYQTDMYDLETGWREDVARRYTFWPVLLGGSLIWVFGFGLLIWGYTRRKKRARAKMARWAQEEALEDARREWAQQLIQRGQVRVVVSDGAAPPPTEAEQRRDGVVPVNQPLPSVEHDGERHTLH